jgi:pimeloyl-ACP methyl ester carboxylesterase
MAHDVTGHVFDAGHDLAEEVPDEVAAVVLSFLAERVAAPVPS